MLYHLYIGQYNLKIKLGHDEYRKSSKRRSSIPYLHGSVKQLFLPLISSLFLSEGLHLNWSIWKSKRSISCLFMLIE
jgi:hypothetical protein